MMKMTALVAESEPVARDQIVSLLDDKSDFQVIGIAASGVETIDAIERLAPDVVFLDPEMPDQQGFGVIDAIGIHRMPPTIVVTADPGHAVRAFEVRALDCFLKPIDPGRFHKAVARARQRVEHDRAGAVVHRLMALVRGSPSTLAPADRLVVRVRGRAQFVETDRIDWVEAQGNYSRLHTESRTYLMRETMNRLFSRLGEHRFFRIHRSRIVRLDAIQELRLAAGGDYAVLLKDGLRLSLSRLYRDALQTRLAEGR
jgi:two-component system LytT family response regulator